MVLTILTSNSICVGSFQWKLVNLYCHGSIMHPKDNQNWACALERQESKAEFGLLLGCGLTINYCTIFVDVWVSLENNSGSESDKENSKWMNPIFQHQIPNIYTMETHSMHLDVYRSALTLSYFVTLCYFVTLWNCIQTVSKLYPWGHSSAMHTSSQTVLTF